MKDSLAMLLKTHREKMSVYRPLAILMKTNELKSISRDVDEKIGGYWKRRGRGKKSPFIGMSDLRNGLVDNRGEGSTLILPPTAPPCKLPSIGSDSPWIPKISRPEV